MELDFVERRVLGVLIEKGYTTPEQYPLSLNYLVSACNQKSCRNPVTQLDEDEVMAALDRLRQHGLCLLVQTVGGRTDRWKHRASEAFETSAVETAVLAELLLRGAQTDGELRQNAKRMRPLKSVDEVHEVLAVLQSREPPLVVRLGPPGRRRGVRFAHTLYPAAELAVIRTTAEEEEAGSNDPDAGEADAVTRSGRAAAVATSSRPDTEELHQRIDALESTLADLADRIDALEQGRGLAPPGP